MPCFIVRVHSTKEAVGIYVADNLEELSWLVDEATDAGDCEAAKIPNGGVTWPSAAKALPLASQDIAEDSPPVLEVIGECTPTDSWFEALFDENLSYNRLERP